MLTHEDFHGCWFTMQAIRCYHAEAAKSIRFTIIDNAPHSSHGEELKKSVAGMSDVDYHTVENVSSTSFRNLVFELAPTDYVLCLDSHVLLIPKAVERLVRFYQKNPHCHDLLQGPLYTEMNYVIATEMEPCWRGDNFGTWKTAENPNDPLAEAFEIPMHGMGLFACSRAGWPRFAPGMRGFGAEEGTIHETFRRLGRSTWCLPFLGWMHRFGKPEGRKYLLSTDSKVRNYLTAFKHAGLPLDSIEAYFKYRINSGQPAQSEAEMRQLMTWAAGLPECSLPSPSGYTPFLGEPIQILD